MAQKRKVLIHTALFSEAKPIVRYFGLDQWESRSVFRGGPIVLTVSGVGGDATLSALGRISERCRFNAAINVGIAGAASEAIPLGALYRVRGGPESVPELPIKTVDKPLTATEEPGEFLVDMEASHFVEAVSRMVPAEDIHVLKVVSDHLDDAIPKSKFVEALVERSIPSWAFLADDYPEKISSVFESTPSEGLPKVELAVIRDAALKFRFSYQELKNIVEMSRDFSIWDQRPVSALLDETADTRKKAYEAVRRQWERLKTEPKTYKGFTGLVPDSKRAPKIAADLGDKTPGFGRCPVASEKTRCCNLLTLDTVEGCGYDCSYCSIRYFYDENAIGFTRGLSAKLKGLEIDPNRIYHIGTGQSSDSLMWGNRDGTLDALLEFAQDHPKVILELKTKSANIDYLKKRSVPPNVVTTWSLNPQVVIDNEEHYTASLERRMEAARELAGRGHLVGFHFHPMVHYDDWKDDYSAIIETMQRDFKPGDAVMVSFGTLTFIKPIIRKMRERPMTSRILQMPLENADGKLSYPLAVKKELFEFSYRAFESWHGKVFFFLCMENISLWPQVFGFDYPDNDAFEADMLRRYMEKIDAKRNRQGGVRRV